MQKAATGQKQMRKVTNMLMDGLGVVYKLIGSGKRPIGRQDFRQDLVQYEQTIRHLGVQKNQKVDLRSTALKDSGSRALEGVKFL